MKRDIIYILKQLREFRDDLLEIIDQLPEVLTGVHLIRKDPASIITKPSQERDKNNLCTHHYQDDYVRKVLKRIIKQTRIENLPNRIFSIIQSEEIRLRRQLIPLNPEFINLLGTKWKGLLYD